jgi:hypothetical protein
VSCLPAESREKNVAQKAVRPNQRKQIIAHLQKHQSAIANSMSKPKKKVPFADQMADTVTPELVALRSTSNDYWNTRRTPAIKQPSNQPIGSKKGDFGLSSLELLKVQLQRKRVQQKQQELAFLETQLQGMPGSLEDAHPSARVSVRGASIRSGRTVLDSLRVGGTTTTARGRSTGRRLAGSLSMPTCTARSTMPSGEKGQLSTARMHELELQAQLLETQLHEINKQLTETDN